MYVYCLALTGAVQPFLFPLSSTRRDIAEIELSVQRPEIYHKVNGIYAPDARVRKDGVIRKLVKESIEALSPTEVSVAWITVGDILPLGHCTMRRIKGA
ncbi:MAG: hypothetical protein VX513_02415 [Pseudomonadota bacterium]|nr:hypothetical protein [Pseudomonadota bacterium]